MTTTNPLQLQGISFVEFSTQSPKNLQDLFHAFGFNRTARDPKKSIELYQQGQIQLFLNSQPHSFGDHFQKLHGPSISAMGWKFKDAKIAFTAALDRGARPFVEGDYRDVDGKTIPAIYGIGDSLIYFIDETTKLALEPVSGPRIEEKGFYFIDHLTNNVPKGQMKTWANFYKDIFGFTEVRYFDIKGQKTGLTSFALRSPDGSFCIPINEANEAKSQINEFLVEYNGPGVQHLAFLTKDLIASMEALQGTSIKTLDIAPAYYLEAFKRAPTLKEDPKRIQDLNILVDGDEDGYLLQIFTQKVVGPIFIELIQRENHHSFGEGNFQALFDSIERDQMKRGVL